MNRHGDRTPTKSYPTDPYRDYPWSVGWGALTTNGSMQLYDMGTCLRRRFKQLLPADGMYSQNNMQALSSHLQRCVMSGQSLLAGLMPPNRDLNRLPIYWQPAAVMGIPKNSDIVRIASTRIETFVLLNFSRFRFRYVVDISGRCEM